MEESILSQSQSVDFSFITLFLKATFTVKIVMLILIFSSVWSWAIIIQKTVDYRKSKKEKKIFLDEFWSGGSLEDLFNDKRDNPQGVCEQIFCTQQRYCPWTIAGFQWRLSIRLFPTEFDGSR